MAEITEFTQYGYGDLRVFRDYSIGISVGTYHLRKFMKKNVIVYNTNMSPTEYIMKAYGKPRGRVHAPQTLFVSSEARLSRDALRIAGYKITYNRDNADTVILTDRYLDGSYPYGLSNYYNYQILVKDNAGVVYMFKVDASLIDQGPGYIAPEVTEKCIEKIRKYFSDCVEILDYNNSLNSYYMYFMRDLPEYRDIILNKMDKPCAFEGDVNIDTDVKINVDTLQIWKGCKPHVVEKQILQSNWQDYPFTLSVFIYYYQRELAGSTNANMKMIIDSINYSGSNPTNSYSGIITPKDWDMTQRFMYSLMQVPEEGGWITANNYDNCFFARDLCKMRVATKPVKLATPMMLEQIKMTIKD